MLNIVDLNYSHNGSVDQQSRLFKGLNLNVNKAEHVVIVGDSGGGKSTLLNLIADQNQSSIQLQAHKKATMVLQEGALLDHLNVIENCLLVVRYSKNTFNDAHIVTTLESLGIDSSLHNVAVSQLSGGQMRRVSIARALLTNPDLILFDEPDAGLDIVNLTRLSDILSSLSHQQNITSITVSHNPFFIAQVANKVYRLQAGQLVLIADWPSLPENDDERQKRQLSLQAELSRVIDPVKPISTKVLKPDWPIKHLLSGITSALGSVFHYPKSLKDEGHIAMQVTFLAFISGIIFFGLVGLMLGSTIIAVVRLLADNAISGLVSLFIKPETLIELMGGRYVVYLAPAIGGMLFAARSGSIIANWLGEMVRGKQVRALSLLGVAPQHYLMSSCLLALFCSMLATLLWFTFSVWLGGVIATDYLFKIDQLGQSMSISAFDLKQSSFWLKTFVYSAFVSIIIVVLGLAKKSNSHQVNIHTTKAIIYSTLAITFSEMCLIFM